MSCDKIMLDWTASYCATEDMTCICSSLDLSLFAQVGLAWETIESWMDSNEGNFLIATHCIRLVRYWCSICPYNIASSKHRIVFIFTNCTFNWCYPQYYLKAVRILVSLQLPGCEGIGGSVVGCATDVVDWVASVVGWVEAGVVGWVAIVESVIKCMQNYWTKSGIIKQIFW